MAQFLLAIFLFIGLYALIVISSVIEKEIEKLDKLRERHAKSNTELVSSGHSPS